MANQAMVKVFYKLVKNGKDIETIKDPVIREAVRALIEAEKVEIE